MWRSLVARLTGGQEVVGSNPVIPTMVTFIAILSILSVVLILCIILTYRSKKPIATSTRRLMISALFPVAANIVCVLSSNYELSGFGYLLYFVSTDWMLAYSLRFIMLYCGYPYRKTIWERLVGLLCGIDTVVLFINPWFVHAFNIEEVVLPSGRVYFKYYSMWYHYIHLGLSYALSITCILILIFKLVKTSALYREKYAVMLLSALLVSLSELYYVFNRSVLEYSMIAYAVFPILVYFFALVYKPYIATYRLFNEVLTHVSEAIFFFDPDNACIYVNRYGREMLEYAGESIDSAWDYAVRVLAGGDPFTMQEIMAEGYYQCIREGTVGEEKFTFDLELHRIVDKKDHTVGAFVTARDRTEEQERLNKERYQATHDSLTGLYNADYLFSRMEKQLIENPSQRYVIVASDIKGFKMVNDIYGRKTGDDVLINIANLIRRAATGDTLYGRLGNDKFGVMVRRDKYREELFTGDIQRMTHLREDMFYPIIIHMGVYEVTDRRIPPSVMFDRAFMAVATIKNDIQNRVAYYDSNLRENMLWEQRLSGSIDAGLDEEQIMPYMQPQVTTDGRIQGVELLARWMHPTEGFLRPRRFLPTLEKNGYVVRLDEYMWERACRTLKRWEEQGWNNLYISVNISPVDFFFVDVLDILTSLIKKYEIEPKKLRLEITENTMMYDAKRRIETIDQLREAGFIVQMDDFGNGFSSLNMLKDLPIDVIKIDMAFLEETRNMSRAKQILESMIVLAKHLEIPVITEGVETREQLDFLANMGCDMFQGHYFAHAMPIEEFEKRCIVESEGRIEPGAGIAKKTEE